MMNAAFVSYRWILDPFERTIIPSAVECSLASVIEI